ncbi:MAG: HDIG domain-containing metalloprotein [Acidobacteriota bacterium]
MPASPAPSPRRPERGRWARLRASLRAAGARLMASVPLWMSLFLLLGTWALVPRSLSVFAERVAAGDIASRTYVADRMLAVPDDARTQALREQARREVLPVYDFDTTQVRERQRQIGRLFAAGRELLASQQAASDDAVDAPIAAPSPAPSVDAADADAAPIVIDRLAPLRVDDDLRLTEPQADVLMAQGFGTELEDRLTGIVARVLRRGIVDDKNRLLENVTRGVTLNLLPSGEPRVQYDLYGYLDHPDAVREMVLEDLSDGGALPRRARRALADFLTDNLAPNVTANRSATLELRRAGEESVGSVTQTLPKGKVIVRRGDEIDAMAALAIAQMSADAQGDRRPLLAMLGTLLLMASVVLVLWLSVRQAPERERSPQRLLCEGLLLLSGYVVMLRFGTFVALALAGTLQQTPDPSAQSSYIYAVPFATLALLSRLIYRRDQALVLAVLGALLAGRLGDADTAWTLVFYCFASSLCAIYALDRLSFRQRSAMTSAGLIVAGGNVLAILILRALAADPTGGLQQLGFDLLCGAIGGLLVAASVSFLVPILESLLGVTTHIKLIELANPNLPLLRRLAFEAPGSFQHSLAVANLAKAGCEAIDADSILVNTCALYHDVGKIVRPQYFIENQMSGRNPHDKIQPTMSALILINHVKEGRELARREKLPQPVIDAIEQHHGTRLIKFFYSRAKDGVDPGADAIREDDFRYPGPRPQRKEMGVLMLADAVEAASRTLVEPSRQKIRTMLRQIFDDCLKDDQLAETDLTLGDLNRVQDAFLRTLTNIYHRRVDYPGFDFNRETRKSRRASSSTSELSTAEVAAAAAAAAPSTNRR